MKRFPEYHGIVKALALALCVVVLSGLVPAGENPAVADTQAFLAKNRAGVMATVEDRQPRTRVFQYLFSDGDKEYIKQ